jgi:hypothetical protein
VDFSQHNKGNFLFPALTANSTMDYSTKVIEDGVVDSPPSCSHVLLMVSLPSPLRGKTRPIVRIMSSAANSRSFQKLCDATFSSIPRALVKVCSILTISFKVFIM